MTPPSRFALLACACLASVASVRALPPINPPPLPYPSPTPSPAIVIGSSVPLPTPRSTPVPPPAPLEENIPVVITYQDGTETRAQITRGLMNPVGIPFDKPVTVTLFLSSGIPGTPVHVGLYDGGQIAAATDVQNGINPPNTGSPILTNAIPIIVIAADQTVRFNFQSGGPLGLYRVLLTIGPKQYLLQFYAVRPRGSTALPPLPTITPSPTPYGTAHP